jgi:hypothetical protein
VSEEQEKTGRCGWAALCLVLVLLSGLLPGSFFGGLTGMRLAELFGPDHAFELGKRLFILAGMIIGLLASTIITMYVTVSLVSLIARFRQAQFTLPEHSFRKD